jgi:hypothetical protein
MDEAGDGHGERETTGERPHPHSAGSLGPDGRRHHAGPPRGADSLVGGQSGAAQETVVGQEMIGEEASHDEANPSGRGQ